MRYWGGGDRQHFGLLVFENMQAPRGLGPNAKIRNTEHYKNGFVAIYYECGHTPNPTKDCQFRARIYYPEYYCSSAEKEDSNALSPRGTVAVEVAARRDPLWDWTSIIESPANKTSLK
jgi:hypothetical protein